MLFLSYAHEDRTLAERLAQALERAGHDVWWDAELQAGVRFRKKIEAALSGAEAVLVLWSESSIASDWVCAEASLGLREHKLLPLSVGGAVPPLPFSELQTIAVDAWAAGSSDEPPDSLLAALRQGSATWAALRGASPRRRWATARMTWVVGGAVALLGLFLWWINAAPQEQAGADDEPCAKTRPELSQYQLLFKDLRHGWSSLDLDRNPARLTEIADRSRRTIAGFDKLASDPEVCPTHRSFAAHYSAYASVIRASASCTQDERTRRAGEAAERLALSRAEIEAILAGGASDEAARHAWRWWAEKDKAQAPDRSKYLEAMASAIESEAAGRTDPDSVAAVGTLLASVDSVYRQKYQCLERDLAWVVSLSTCAPPWSPDAFWNWRNDCPQG